MYDLEPGVATPPEQLLLGVTRGVGRVIPVEVDQVAHPLAKLLVPEALEERPVDQALDVVLAGLEPEQRDALRPA